ncbi:MAG TPA: YcaO-like family protein [Rhizomicrobium sp.]|nr:YcaO-like family protein [Rhizomicrobium sp.]
MGARSTATGAVSGSAAAETLKSLAPHLPAFGITRVGLLTGLDVLGIPVAFATRPNSRALSVTQGKALCADEARLGAVMEAFEQAFAERSETLTVRVAALPDVVERAVDLTGLKRAARLSGQEIAWARATSLVSGAEQLVPLELVGLDLRGNLSSGFSATPVSGLGLGAGMSWEAAATHALLEIVEHNATTATDIFGFLPGFARPVRVCPGDDTALDDIVARIERAGLCYQLYDLTSPGGLPVIGATLDCPDLVPGWMQFAGYACRFSPEHAAEAALLEAIQSRLTVIAGARDDLEPQSYCGGARCLGDTPHGGPLRALPRAHAQLRHAAPRDKLAQALECAIALGAQDVLVATLGEIPGLVSVVRVIASNLEAMGYNAPTALGRRTLEALFAKAGTR